MPTTPDDKPKTWREKARSGLRRMLNGGLLTAAEGKTARAEETQNRPSPSVPPRTGPQFGEPPELTEEQKRELRRLREQIRGTKPVTSTSSMSALRRRIG
jgi:membrane peptidoglycan carboxypeptidase